MATTYRDVVALADDDTTVEPFGYYPGWFGVQVTTDEDDTTEIRTFLFVGAHEYAEDPDGGDDVLVVDPQTPVVGWTTRVLQVPGAPTLYAADGRCLGSTSYYDVDAVAQVLAAGAA